MRSYLNNSQVPLSVAVYLATDHYEFVPNAISATSVMKPVRQAVLTPRVPTIESASDVLDLAKSRMGTSIHDGIEKAWDGGHYIQAMKDLGYPDHIIDRIAVNPPDDTLTPEMIPVYMEQRMFREIDGKTVSGKYDFIAEGRLEDFKSTGTFTWTNNTKTEDYQLQGSIYRWIDAAQPVPKITQDHMAIQFFFWDWKAYEAKRSPDYPQQQILQQLIPLLSLADTEAYIVGKLKQFEQYQQMDEDQIPLCSDKELWRKKAVFKYYRDKTKTTGRSTKNFPTSTEAYDRLMKDGGAGIVKEVPGEVVACKYCQAFPVCTQKDVYITDGSLKL